MFWALLKDFFFKVASCLPVEVMHGITGVAGDLVETLSSAHSLLYGILVIHNLIIWQRREPAKKKK